MGPSHGALGQSAFHQDALAPRGSCPVQHRVIRGFPRLETQREGKTQYLTAERISGLTELSVTTIKIRGLEAVEQVRTGQNTCLCVPELSSTPSPPFLA